MAKNKIYLTITLVVLFIFSLFKFIFSLEKDQKVIFLDIWKIILENWFNLVFIVIIVGTFIYLLKYSHRISQEKLAEYDNKPCDFTVDILNQLRGKIYIKYVDNEVKISLENISNIVILKANGFMSLYKGKVRIKKIPFDLTYLEPGYSEIIYKSAKEIEFLNFNDFDIYIDKVETQNSIHRNRNQRTPTFFRTYDKILNIDSYIDTRLFGMNVRYNLVYLKEKSKLVLNLIRFLYKKKTFGKQNIFKRIGSFIGRSLIFIIIYGVLFFMILVTLYSFYKSIIMVVELLPLLYDVFKSVYKK